MVNNYLHVTTISHGYDHKFIQEQAHARVGPHVGRIPRNPDRSTMNTNARPHPGTPADVTQLYPPPEPPITGDTSGRLPPHEASRLRGPPCEARLPGADRRAPG
jgi:hypothetical protein